MGFGLVTLSRNYPCIAASTFLFVTGFGILAFSSSSAYADSHPVKIETAVDGNDSVVQNFFDGQGERIKTTSTYTRGDKTVVTTVNAEFEVSTETTVVTEIPDPDDATSTIRTVSISRRMDDLALPYETVVSQESNSVISSGGALPGLQTKTTKIYSKSEPRRLLKKVRERKRLILINENGEPVYETIRTTTAGDETTVESFDAKSGQWQTIDAATTENGGSNGSGAASGTNQICTAKKAGLAETVDEITDISDQIATLKNELDDLDRDITAAKSWRGLPRHYQMTYREFEDESKNYWDCPVCKGPEKSIVNQFHRWACAGSNGTQVIHPEPLPTDVTDYQFVYELKLRARRTKALEDTGLCGKGISPAGQILFTNWGLRDDYLDTMEPALVRKTEALSTMMEQLDRLKSRAQIQQEEFRRECRRTDRTIPRLSGPPRSQTVEPETDCERRSLVGGVGCVDEQMGE